MQERSGEGVANLAAQRLRIETQLANVRTKFELGDLSKEDYVERREHLMRQKDSLRETDEWEGILAQAAVFLSDLPAAWHAAHDAQRNALIRMLLVQVQIKEDRVVAVEPQPSFAPIFSWDCQVRHLSGGSDGIRTRIFRTCEPCTVGSPTGTFERGPTTPPVGRRDIMHLHTHGTARTRRLTPEHEYMIRALAKSRSLRSLADAEGVS